MKAEIVLVGTELLLGQISDTNSAFLAGELAKLGLDLFHIQIVGDNLERMVAAFRQALDRADLLLISGGLGPTADDLTREALALLIEEPLELRTQAWRMIESFFQRRNLPCTVNNKRQAMYPPSAEIMENKWGTAPGVWIYKNHKYIAALPGVPRELERMFTDEVVPRLKKTGKIDGTIFSRHIHMVGIGEAAMEEKISDLMAGQTNPTIAPYAGDHEVMVRITAKASDYAQASALVMDYQTKVLERLGEYCYGFDDISLPKVIAGLLTQKQLTLAVAESCTGGLLSHLLTNIPGISANFVGGIVAYDNRLKTELLGVDPDTLRKYGAVSRETAREMAWGVRSKLKADIGIGITGIAGPGGGSREKPVGLVYISLVKPDMAVIIEKHQFPWEREVNKAAAAKVALALLWKSLKGSGE